ncbi:2-octaprenyl-6-methoxy-1,4-benzoquinone methylase [Aureococcus anophagefferens]|nr:2-octaprenyl-6-methoxy-1,4-benzoquinone methylase [Aureococcus anophagefferens]
MKPGPALVGVLSAILVGLLVTLGGLEEGAPAEDLGTGQMFNRIARRYDLANKFMSLGMDQGWRRGLVAALELAPSDRVAAAGLDGTVELALGDATDLEHLADGGFDKISISFGIRNIPDVDGALREMRRVAAPGATLAVMRSIAAFPPPPAFRSKVERAGFATRPPVFYAAGSVAPRDGN